MEKEKIKIIQTALQAPFTQTVNGVVLPAHKWLPKMLTAKKDKFVLIPYLDRDQVIGRLNNVLGFNWNFDARREDDGQKTGTLIIDIDGQKVCRTDTGTEKTTGEGGSTKDKVEKEKASTTDALKRCAAQFGVGTYLNNLPVRFVSAKMVGKKYVPVDDKGHTLYANQLSNFVNGISVGRGFLYQWMQEMPHIWKRDDIKKLWEEFK
jgi:hypothetical protein